MLPFQGSIYTFLYTKSSSLFAEPLRTYVNDIVKWPNAAASITSGQRDTSPCPSNFLSPRLIVLIVNPQCLSRDSSMPAPHPWIEIVHVPVMQIRLCSALLPVLYHDPPNRPHLIVLVLPHPENADLRFQNCAYLRVHGTEAAIMP